MDQSGSFLTRVMAFDRRCFGEKSRPSLNWRARSEPSTSGIHGHLLKTVGLSHEEIAAGSYSLNLIRKVIPTDFFNR